MNYSITYKNTRGESRFKEAIEYKSNVIDAEIKNKNWLIENPSHIEKIPNVTYALGFHKKELIQQAIREGIPFMFLEPIQTWEYLYFAVFIVGVSQVRISGELGFDIKKVSKFCHDNNVLVRIKDPQIPSSTFIELNPLEKFFIIPQWVKYFENYVDIIEFSDITREKTLINTYCYFGKWIGDLNYLTEGAIKDIDATALPKEMGRRRPNCKRDCIKGGNCKLCNVAIDFAKKLQENKLIWREENE